MIREVSGDILLSEAAVIAHGVSPNDSFHAGLALQLREHWPAMYKDFRHYCQTHHPKPGGVWTWMAPGGKRIVNLFTQESAYGQGERPGRATTHNVGHAMKALRELIEREGYTSVALPRLATGVGGLDWNEVQPIIEQHLGDLQIPILIYVTYHAGRKAEERL
ncbi:MAG: macro domain-containing protein [Gammaproteobacteria bacterium]